MSDTKEATILPKAPPMDHTDSHVDNVTAKCKSFKILQKAGHHKTPFNWADLKQSAVDCILCIIP